MLPIQSSEADVKGDDSDEPVGRYPWRRSALLLECRPDAVRRTCSPRPPRHHRHAIGRRESDERDVRHEPQVDGGDCGTGDAWTCGDTAALCAGLRRRPCLWGHCHLALLGLGHWHHKARTALRCVDDRSGRRRVRDAGRSFNRRIPPRAARPFRSLSIPDLGRLLAEDPGFPCEREWNSSRAPPDQRTSRRGRPS